jgi:hypothetical protein
MMFRIIIILALLLLASCTQKPDLNKVTLNFNTNIENFDTLTEMIKQDYKSGICFEVGEDKIGDYYKFDDYWGDEKLTLDKVLDKYSISSTRYATYQTLFRITKTERVSYCVKNKNESYSFLAYRSGLGISGCALMINKEYPTPKSTGRPNNGEDFTEITALKDDWFIEYSCT